MSSVTQTGTGTCPNCNTVNPLTAKSCTMCSANLPWFQPTTAASSPQPAKSDGALNHQLNAFTQQKTQKAAPSSGGAGYAWGAMGVQLAGGVVFVAGVFFFCGNVFGFFPTFRGVGYITMAIGGAIWRAGSSMD